MIHAISAIRLLGAVLALTFVLNGAAFAYEQIADACHGPESTIADVQEVATSGGNHAAGDIDGGHCCHAHGVVAGIPVSGRPFDGGRLLTRAWAIDALYERMPLAPPVPPPNA